MDGFPTDTGILVFPGDPQYFLDGGLAAQDSGAPVVADRRRRQSGVALELLLARSIVDHRAHGVIHDDELIDTRAAAVASHRIASRPVEHRGGIVRTKIEESPLVVPPLEGLLGFRVRSEE